MTAMTLSLEISPEQTERLVAAARRLKVEVEELAAAALRDLLARPEPDFQDAAQHVLAKNRTLYQRLS